MKTNLNLISIKCLMIISLCFVQVTSYCRDKDSKIITIKGITTNTLSTGDSQKLDSVTINVYDYNLLLKTYNSNSEGKFEFDIPINSYITIEFKKNNYVEKRILFDTRVTSGVKHIKPFNLEIVLLNDVYGIDYSELDFPITSVVYDNKMEDFTFKKKYTERMMKKQEDILAEMVKN